MSVWIKIDESLRLANEAEPLSTKAVDRRALPTPCPHPVTAEAVGQERPGPQKVLFYELLFHKLLGTLCPFLIAPLDQCKADLSLIYSLLYGSLE